MVLTIRVSISLIVLWLLSLLTGQPGYAQAVGTPVNATPRVRRASREHLSPRTRPAGQEERSLALGEPVRREIAGGQSHSYRISLTPGVHARVVVEQRGIDLVVSAFTPDEKKLFDLNGPPGPAGAEVISIPAEVTGDYKLQVRAEDKHVAPGGYEIRVEGVRPPEQADLTWLSAEKLFAEGQQERLRPDEESQRRAAGKFERALALWREANDPARQANAAHNLADVHKSLGDLPKASEHYESARSLRRGLGDLQGEAYTLNDIGAAYRDLKSPEDALGYYRKALEIFRETGNRLGEATSLHSTGYAYALLGDMRKALENYEQALAIRRAVKERRGEINTLNAMAGAFYGLGELVKSLETAEEAARVWHESGEPIYEALAINNAGLIYDDWGNWQKAQEYYRRALDMLQSLKNSGPGTRSPTLEQIRKRGEATVLDNLGTLYTALAEPQKALELHRQALSIRRELKQPRGIGTTLSRVGYAYYLLDEPQRALEQYKEALTIVRGVGDKRYQAYTLTLMGMLYASQRDYREALKLYREALRFQQELEDMQGQALTLDKLAQAQALAGEHAAGFESFHQALELWRAVRDPHGEAITLYNLARAERGLGRLSDARMHVERAIGNVEALRTSITSQKLRTSYFVAKQEYYALLIDLRMRLHDGDPSAGHDAAALEANERARARGLIDTLAEAQVDIRQGVDDPELVKLEQTLRRRLSDKVAAARRLNPSGRGQSRDQLNALEKEIEELSSQYDDVRAQIRSRSPRYAELTQPRSLSLAEIQHLLDDDTLLLEYALGDERSYLWAVDRAGRISSHLLPPRAEIEAAAARFLKLLTAPEPVEGETPERHRERVATAKALYPKEAAVLSEAILGPATERLGGKRLLVVSDGMLQYIPFAALPAPPPKITDDKPGLPQVPAPAVGREPLVENHEIVELPSASTLATLRAMTNKRSPAPLLVAVLADPVFMPDDARIPQPKRPGPATARARGLPPTERLRRALRGGALADEVLPRLPFTQMEADAIMSVTPKGQGVLAAGFEANYETATGGRLGQHRVVHFATHGLLDSEHPELSGLVLSLYDRQGQPKKYGFLRLPDIYNLNLPAELVVLSACRTGLGKQLRGEGIVGLTRGFMYAGAPRVVASLWRVDDQATAELMKRFYHHMFREQKTPAAALRAAQQDIRRQKSWRDPYHWAAFVLHGEWK